MPGQGEVEQCIGILGPALRIRNETKQVMSIGIGAVDRKCVLIKSGGDVQPAGLLLENGLQQKIFCIWHAGPHDSLPQALA